MRGTLASRGPAKVFGGDLLLMDVFAAQIAFGRGKRFDYVDVVPTHGPNVDQLGARIRAAIGRTGRGRASRASLRRKPSRSSAASSSGSSLASMVAIFVGAFIVYNALAIAVAQRRREIGILRALGVTRRQVMALFVGEGVLIGAIGAGVRRWLAGMGLARSSLVRPSARRYLSCTCRCGPTRSAGSPSQLVVGLAIGVGASFVASFFPASRAAYVEPATAMRKKADASEVGLS